jgi:origin recognition complex subunit 2
MSVEALLESTPRQNTEGHVYVVVHNIDASSLRSASEQGCLSLLAACPNVRMLASVDHINAAALFDSKQRKVFRWLWHHMPTLEPLWHETMHSEPVLANVEHHATQQSASVVLSMLTQSSRSVRSGLCFFGRDGFAES